nr:hypothetical protein [Tanacetum cinerariifolium]
AIRVRCWPTNRIRGFGQLGKRKLHIGRSGRGHGYCSGSGEVHRKGWWCGEMVRLRWQWRCVDGDGVVLAAEMEAAAAGGDFGVVVPGVSWTKGEESGDA